MAAFTPRWRRRQDTREPMELALPTKQQVRAVKDSWAALKTRPGLATAGESFFLGLFAAHPEALGMFTKFKDEQKWQHSAAFKAHARTVMKALDSAVGDLDDLDSLVPKLRKLGFAHAKVGAKPEHYDWVGTALIEALQKALGLRMTLHVTEAYKTVYGLVRAIMLEASNAAAAGTGMRSPSSIVQEDSSSSEDEIPGRHGAPLQANVDVVRSTSAPEGEEQQQPVLPPRPRPKLRYTMSSSTPRLDLLARVAPRTEGSIEANSLVIDPHGSIARAGLGFHNGKPSSVIWVGSIPDSGKSENLEKEIRRTFGTFGEIRRVFLRFKPENGSWCMLHFRAASAAAQALAASRVTMPDSTGTDVVLRVEQPRVIAERNSSGTCTDSDGQSPQNAEPPTKMQKPVGKNAENRGRRPSLTEETVRNALSVDVGAGTPERVESLRPDHRSARNLWGKIQEAAQSAVPQSPGDSSNSLYLSQSSGSQSVSALAQDDEGTEKAVRKAIKKALHEVRVEEKEITKVIRAIVEMQGGDMQGLDFRFKSQTSCFRKVMARIDMAARTTTDPSIPGDKSSPTPEAFVASIVDLLRYSAVFPTKTYTQSVQACLQSLPQRGMKELRVKNFWGPGDNLYQGINSVFVYNGIPFELQFHTPESFATKEMECHASYERFRTEDDSRKIMQYWEEMVSMWDSVPIPPDVLEIPVIVQQKLQFDLSMLTTQEKLNIRYRKDLEKQCRYPVDELHTRARKANDEVLYLMQYLLHKHGAEDDCELMDTKKTLVPQVSILRRLVDHFLALMDYANNPGDTHVTAACTPESAGGPSEPPRQTLTLTEVKSDGEGCRNPSLDVVDSRATSAGDSPNSFSSGRSRRRSVDMTMNGESFAKLKIGVTTTLREVGKNHTSVDYLSGLQQTSSSDDGDNAAAASSFAATPTTAATTSDSDGGHQGGPVHPSRSLSDMPMPEIEKIRDVLREMQAESPALSYKIVCGEKTNYTSCVLGILHDMASLAEYDVLAVNNWWDDVEKFGAINALVMSARHGVRFGVTFHTDQSWSAYNTHLKYLRYKFDTVIKTDILFAGDPARVAQAKMELRREVMFRDSWIQIAMPDDVLTVGTLRYAHKPKPSATRLQDDALHTVGKSDETLRHRFHQPVRKVMHINRWISRDEQNDPHRSLSAQSDPDHAASETQGEAFLDRLDDSRRSRDSVADAQRNNLSEAAVSSLERSNKRFTLQDGGQLAANVGCDSVGYADLELSLVASFFRAAPEIGAQFEEHRQRVVAERGSPLLWLTTRPSSEGVVRQHETRLLQLEAEVAWLRQQTKTGDLTATSCEARQELQADAQASARAGVWTLNQFDVLPALPVVATAAMLGALVMRTLALGRG